jgi:SagB-type dehydrogenase family enzyme
VKKGPTKDYSLESALKDRQTIRELTGGYISRDILDDLVWAAYGHTHSDGPLKMRTAPSAGATYPVEIYLVLHDVDDYPDGLYLYDTRNERLTTVKEGGFLNDICRASLNQDFIPLANATFLLVYNPDRIASHYGRESLRYALLECGHIAQNILLMATARGMGSVPVGAFYQKRLGSIIGLQEDREVLYMICVGTLEK